MSTTRDRIKNVVDNYARATQWDEGQRADLTHMFLAFSDLLADGDGDAGKPVASGWHTDNHKWNLRTVDGEFVAWSVPNDDKRCGQGDTGDMLAADAYARDSEDALDWRLPDEAQGSTTPPEHRSDNARCYFGKVAGCLCVCLPIPSVAAPPPADEGRPMLTEWRTGQIQIDCRYRYIVGDLSAFDHGSLARPDGSWYVARNGDVLARGDDGGERAADAACLKWYRIPPSSGAATPVAEVGTADLPMPRWDDDGALSLNWRSQDGSRRAYVSLDPKASDSGWHCVGRDPVAMAVGELATVDLRAMLAWLDDSGPLPASAPTPAVAPLGERDPFRALKWVARDDNGGVIAAFADADQCRRWRTGHCADRAPTPAVARGDTLDLVAHLHRQRAFSERTFGPGARTAGVCDHIRKELREIEAAPADITEWVDVVLLALDGAWRSGATPEQIAEAITAKQAKNEGRKWPDWRTVEPGKAIEHDRTGESAVAPPAPVVRALTEAEIEECARAGAIAIDLDEAFLAIKGWRRDHLIEGARYVLDDNATEVDIDDRAEHAAFCEAVLSCRDAILARGAATGEGE